LTTCEQLWDFLYAKDAANALYLIGKQNKEGVYNLGYGESRKLARACCLGTGYWEPKSFMSLHTRGDASLNWVGITDAWDISSYPSHGVFLS